MELFYVSCVMSYFYHTLCASIFFLFYYHEHGVFLFCSYSEGYVTLSANQQIVFFYLLPFLTHSICIYYCVSGGNGNRARSRECTCTADTAFVMSSVDLHETFTMYSFYGEHTIKPS